MSLSEKSQHLDEEEKLDQEQNYSFDPRIHSHIIHHDHEEAEVMDATAKLGGVILRKAELHDFEDTYIRVFEKIAEIQVFGTEDILEILGNIGG